MRSLQPSRLSLSTVAGASLALLVAATVGALGPPYPEPVENQAVYDAADLLSQDVEASLEERIDAIEARTGAELVIYTEPNTDISEDQNFENARTLMDQWGVGRSGFDDGLVILIAKDPDAGETRISTFAGSGFLSSYADEEALRDIREGELVPFARAGDWDGALLATVDALDVRITPDARDRLDALRVLNAAVGIVGAPLALIVTLGSAWIRWRREGDDPELVDSPSILMAGPPADMTPALATVLMQGRANQHSLNTALLELASSGRISFRNLDQVGSVKSDDEPNELLDPAIDVHAEARGADELGAPQQQAWEIIRGLDLGAGSLSRERLWRLNSSLGPVRSALEGQAVRLGWLSRLPTAVISRSSGIAIGEIVLGMLAVWAGISVPMSGALLLGAAFLLGGIATLVFAQAMSKRTASGAYVDAMLKAYRRTLAKTLEQARNMNEVVAEPTVRALADTPDKAVVWGTALGLHGEIAEVLARGLADHRASGGTVGDAYYPAWLGSTAGSARSEAGMPAPGGVVDGGGSIFSGSPIPDIGGMFDALGSVGSTPSTSSSSGGGGFSGGGSSGGGGGSSSV